MAKDTTLIIHGWSDCSNSFKKLKQFLIDNKVGTVQTILYADYESREDNVTFNDVVDGLNDQMIENGLIDADGNKLKDVNVIVHSTGGLVIRHWIWQYYHDRIEQCPVKRLVMLAPANFGSPLAHRGKSFMGSLFKGRWKIGDMLEVGRNLLNGLELASPYQWDLAHEDVLREEPYYNRGQIQTTILVGLKDYEGLRGWVNKPGTDGTVVIAGTSLDTAKLVLDFSQSGRDPAKQHHDWEYQNPPDDFGFGVIAGVDHGSIVEPTSPKAGDKGMVGGLVLRALTTKTPKDFEKLINDLEQYTESCYQKTGKPRFQQFVLHAVDDLGDSIKDFTVEFFIFRPHRLSKKGLADDSKMDKLEKELSQEVHEILTANFHTNQTDASFRRFLVDLEEIRVFLNKAEEQLGAKPALSMRVHVPKVDDGIQYENKDLENIVIHDTSGTLKPPKNFFYENTTTFIELRVNRFNNYVHIGVQPRKH